jgi:hypothetical protein
MGVTTVKRHLGVLEAEGWILRDRPEIARARKEHARTQYALMMPVLAIGHGPEGAMPRPAPDHGMAPSEPRHGPEGAGARSGAGHKSSLNPNESPVSTTSSSLAEASPEAPTTVGPAVTDGGGGGSLSSRAIAEEITAALDYRGKPPDKRQRKTIADRLTAALDGGWSVDGLAFYLDLGTAPVDSPAAVYAHRLKPGILPDAAPVPAPRLSGGVRDPLPTSEEYANLTIDDVLGTGRPAGGMWEQATARARQRTGSGHRPFECPPASAYTGRGFGTGGGTDERVLAHAALTAQLRAAEAAEAALPPYCGDWDCDPRTRLRDQDVGRGLKASIHCPKCHPSTQS